MESHKQISQRKAAVELPLYVRFEEADMFAILTVPEEPAKGVGVVIAHGRSDQQSCHRNQVSARFARALAGRGFHVVRFDYPGLSDSSGVSRGFALGISHDREIVSIVNDLRRRGIERIFLVGYCIGGRSALAALDHLTGIEGVVMVTSPLRAPAREPAFLRAIYSRSGGAAEQDGARRSTLRKLSLRLLSVGSKLNPSVEDPIDPMIRRRLAKLMDSNGAALLLYGDTDTYSDEAREFMARIAGDQKFNGVSLNDKTPEPMHGFLSVPAQEAFLHITLEWLSAKAAAASVNNR